MPLRTIVYVDGFNLYYGALRRTPWKWLDLLALSRRMLDSGHAIAGIKTEEKGSDVNLASHLLLDAARNRFDCGVLVTGDSDLTTPVRMVIGEFGKTVGVLNPQKHFCQTLRAAATFYKHIRPSALAASQFPDRLTDAKGSFSKPAVW